MPSSYSSNLRLELIAAGEQANTWGNTTNTNLGTLLESAIAGRVELSSGWSSNSITLSAFNGANDQARQMCLVVPAITISANSTIIVPASAVTSSSGKLYTVINKSLSYSVTIKLAASTGVTIPANTAKTVVYNGTDFQEAFTAHDLLTLTGTPTTTLHAVNKGYVDTKFFSIADNNTVTGNTTFTGTVTLPTSTPTGNQATSYNYVNTNYLWKASGVSTQTMIPRLKLTASAVDNDDAITLGQVNSNFVGISSVQTISGAKTFSGNVSLSGSATLTLAADPLSNMQASTKQYVDTEISTALSAASGIYALKATNVIAGSGIQINGTSSGTLGSDLTISVVGGGTVTSVTATAPLAASGSTAVNLSIPPATASQNGYLLSTAYDAFDKKCNANGSNATAGSTWNISILGNAATASSVAWTSVTSRPTAVSAFTNDAGYLTSVAWTQVSGRPTALSQFTNDTNFVNAGYVSSYANQYTLLNSGTTITTGVVRFRDVSSTTNYGELSYLYDATLGSNAFRMYSKSSTTNYNPIAWIVANNSTTKAVLFTGLSGNLNVGTSIAFSLNDYILGGTTGASIDNDGRIIRTPSDASLKENVVSLTDGLAQTLALNPVYYDWIDKKRFGEGKQLGFIAQEVQEILPEVVSHNPDKTLSLDYAKLTATLTSAIQELNAKIEALTAEVATLKGA